MVYNFFGTIQKITNKIKELYLQIDIIKWTADKGIKKVKTIPNS